MDSRTRRISRAIFFLGLVLGPAARAGELWSIPEAAWQRPIGVYPKGASGVLSPLESLALPDSRTKRGVPVGGIGTGSFMLNMTGSFGPWEFDIGGDNSFLSRWGSEWNSGHEERFPPQAAFHVFEKSASRVFVKTMSTEDVLSAWPRLPKGQGKYYALFPKAWFVYEGFPAPLAMEQFSPFVARNEKLSSLPVGLFSFAVFNPAQEPVEVAVMFTFPNAIYRGRTVSHGYPRKGLRTRVENTRELLAVRLQAEHPDNVPETRKTEWVIAVRNPGGATLSYVDDWAADKNGADVLSDFSDDGVLSDKSLDSRGKGLAGAVAVKVTLAPGERKVLPFALAWDFPVVQFKNTTTGTKWEKRYKQWYPGDFQGFAIARDALLNAAAWEQAVDGWWRKIADETAYPLWLRQAALNELYYDLFGGVFWENRCLSKPKRFGARPGQHLYFTHEATVYRDAETIDVSYYQARHMIEMFPTIQRDVLLGWADMIMDDPLGRTPHDAGSPMNDPWFIYGQYYSTSPGMRPPDMNWKDNPSRFVQEAHACWKYTGDNQFLREVYPAAKRTLAYLATTDKNGNGLPESTGGDTSYDAFSLRGESTYVSGLYLGALLAMSEMARAVGKAAEAEHYQDLADAGRAQAEKLLWVDQPGYYKIDVRGPFSKCNAHSKSAKRFTGAPGRTSPWPSGSTLRPSGTPASRLNSGPSKTCALEPSGNSCSKSKTHLKNPRQSKSNLRVDSGRDWYIMRVGIRPSCDP